MKGRLYQKLLNAEATIQRLEKENNKLKAELDTYRDSDEIKESIRQEFEDKQNGIIRS